jgi:hypothetical protein
MKHGLNTDMRNENLKNNVIPIFGGSQGVGQEIIKIVETNKLVRWNSFNPKTREYEFQSPDGVKKIHESKTTKEFTSQEELVFFHSEKTQTEFMNEAASKVTIVCLLGILIFAAIGCQTTQSQNANTPTTAVTDPLDATNKCGVSLRDAQTKSLNLEAGMTQDRVASLLCKPDETSVETFGTQTPQPWNGFEWVYYWGPRIWRLDGKNPHNTLTIIFEKKLNNWVVNTWIWSGPP